MSVAEVVTAFAQSDLAKLDDLVEHWPADDPQRAAVAFLHQVVSHRIGSPQPAARLPDEVAGPLDQLLGDLPTDPDLHLMVLAVAARQAIATADTDRPLPERLSGCEGLLQRGHRLLPHCQHLRSRALIHRLESEVGRITDDPERRLRAAEVILGDPEVEDDPDLALEFTLQRLRGRIDDHRLLDVEGDLVRLIAESDRCRQKVGYDPLWLQDYYWLLVGDYERILATSDTGWQAFRRPRDAIAIYGRLYAQRFDEIRQFLKSKRRQLERQGLFAQPRSDRVVSFYEIQAELALIEGRLEEARTILRRCNACAEDPHRYLPLQLLRAVNIELAAGNPRRARASLELLDPHSRRGDCLMAWCRLLLLEGDRTGAARLFCRIRQRTPPGYLEHQLRFAHELSPADALWLNRQQPSADEEAAPPPKPVRQRTGTELIGDSPAMAAVRRQIATFAPLDQTVLITGETGTGKECVARLLHEQSQHPKAPFLPLNCAALPDALAESELFGHVRGAFTGADTDMPGLIAAAGEGTVFLDEIASLSPRLQGVLLRVLETGDYRAVGDSRQRRRRARVVVASNIPLADAVAAGDFRADLYYRLARFTITVPPLRERLADIPALCRHFIATSGSGRTRLDIDAGLLARLHRHRWPGNVRELRNEIERLLVLAPGSEVLTDDGMLILDSADGPTTASPPTGNRAVLPNIPGLPQARRRRQAIVDLLRQRGRLARAEIVDELGCAPSTATADLKALSDQGFIERITTSAHLRTSYFVLTGSDQRRD